MVVGLGVDVFEVSRMERALREGDPGFSRQLFTPEELAYGERQPNPARLFSEWFALKEAVLKALSAPDAPPLSWRDIEFRAGSGGDCSVTLHGSAKSLADARGVGRVRVSMSHANGLAVARAILEDADE